MRYLKQISWPVRVGLLLLLVVGVVNGWFYVKHRSEVVVIKQRYQSFRHALSTDDQAGIAALIAPGYHDSEVANLSWIRNSGGPWTEKTRVQIAETHAWVTPKPLYHFYVLPGGDTIEMIKVDGEWFFTGRISID